MEMQVTQVGIPLDEFIRFYDAEGPFEIINRERIVQMPKVAGHGEIVELLFLAIYALVSTKSLGKIVRELPFVLSCTAGWVTASRVPDLMFFTGERFNAYKATTPDWKYKPYSLVPDLVIEVVSPNDNLSELDDKVEQ
jgi:Uma2 family endonuclease